MDTLPAIARQRAVMTAVADMIVAAAAGKSLRIAVGCSDLDQMSFADHLTRALHARGRPCRCLQPTPNSGAGGGSTAAGGAGGPVVAVAVITSGASSRDETDLCRIDIQLHAPVRGTASVDSAHREPDGPATAPWLAVEDREPDIVIDYFDPDGPAIRHIAPALIRLPARPSDA